jgi:hypothetical protein
MINVLTYGAVGNGTTDDYQAIQNALNEAVTKQEELYFPKPTAHYKCSQPLTVPTNWKGIHIRGEDGGSAALPDYGVEIRFTGTGGFQFRMHSSSN